MAGMRLFGMICIFLYALSASALDITVEPETVTPGGTITISWSAQQGEGDQALLTVEPPVNTNSLITLDPLGPTGSTEITIQTHAPINREHTLELPDSPNFHPVTFTVNPPNSSSSSASDASATAVSSDSTSSDASSSVSTQTTSTSTSSNITPSTITSAPPANTSFSPTQSTTIIDSSATQNSATASPQSRISLPKGAIAGIAVGAFALCFILLGLLICFCKRYIRSWKKRPNSPIVHVTHTHSFSVDPFLIGKVSAMTTLESKGMLNETSRATTPSDYSGSADFRYHHDTRHLRADSYNLADSTTSAGSESVLPEYPTLGVNNPYNKYLGKEKEKLDNDEDSYGSLTSQQMVELNEQRKKMRELIEVMKERRNSATLENGPGSPVRGLDL